MRFLIASAAALLLATTPQIANAQDAEITNTLPIMAAPQATGPVTFTYFVNPGNFDQLTIVHNVSDAAGGTATLDAGSSAHPFDVVLCNASSHTGRYRVTGGWNDINAQTCVALSGVRQVYVVQINAHQWDAWVYIRAT